MCLPRDAGSMNNANLILSSSDTAVNTVDGLNTPLLLKYVTNTMSTIIIGVAIRTTIEYALANAKLRIAFSSILRNAVNLYIYNM
jgi:mannose/fructose-specific phosphotransferase system component IIA